MRKAFVVLAVGTTLALLTGCTSAVDLEKEKLATYTEVSQAVVVANSFVVYGPAVEGEGFDLYSQNAIALQSLLENSSSLSDAAFIDAGNKALAERDEALDVYGTEITTYYNVLYTEELSKANKKEVATYQECLELTDSFLEKFKTSSTPAMLVNELDSCDLVGVANRVAGEVGP